VKTRLLRIVAQVLLAALVLYFFVRRADTLRAYVSQRDSIAYWTAGLLLLAHANPYDVDQVLEMEQQQGYVEQKPLVLRTPPWSLFMVLGLGVLDAFWAWVVWIAASVGALLISMRLCWRIYGAQQIPQNLFWIVGYLFAPVPACLVAGQMGIMLLLGLVLFLWWEVERPYLAGAALILPFAKPHLLSLFWFALIFWVISRRKWALATGFIAAFGLACFLPLLFDPHVFANYREMLRRASVGLEFIPALSGVIRLLFFRRWFWIQFVPLAIGFAWCVRFVGKHRANWNWREHAAALIVTSVLTTPYAWLTDEVVVLPAILQAAAWIYLARKNLKVAARIAVFVFALLNLWLLLILRSKIPFATGIYFWSSIVWFSFYLFGRSKQSKKAALLSGPAG
jgi:hypothetical protein